jgi:Nucleotidyl transferase AbiEii toxin, Type IV TA system
MALSEKYRHQVALLIETIPFVAAEPDFALKGGTAINLFYRDTPRLSVDIDLTYLPVAARPESLAAINAAMRRIAAAIRRGCVARVSRKPSTPVKRS